jgi:hypothetical protein
MSKEKKKDFSIEREKKMFELSFKRPKDFFQLNAEEQWDIDNKLGILDWHGRIYTDEDRSRFEEHYSEFTIIAEQERELKINAAIPKASKNYSYVFNKLRELEQMEEQLKKEADKWMKVLDEEIRFAQSLPPITKKKYNA